MQRRFPHRRALAAALVAAWATCAVGTVAKADHAARGLGVLPENDPKNADTLPKELQGVGIEPNLGMQLPKDVKLVDQDGKAVTFGEYVDGTKPTLLVFAYYACPMLCTLVLNGAMEAMKELPFRLGEEYRIVTVSFDGRDTPQIAKDKRANYLKELGRPANVKDWDFLTGDAAEVKKLADAAGFHYRWNEEAQEFAHAAGMFVVTPEGRLSQVLSGVRFDPKDLRLALTEASGGKIGTLTERILLFCFHYEPKAGKYVVRAKTAMSLGGAVTVLVLGISVALFMRGEKKRQAALPPVRETVQQS